MPLQDRGLPPDNGATVAFCSLHALPPSVPRLDDDGRSVTLDLHGARVDEALAMTEAALAAAARLGRSTVRVVHGHSTTGGGARTIKSAVLDALDRGAFDRHVVSDLRGEGHVLFGLAVSGAPSPVRLRLADVW